MQLFKKSILTTLLLFFVTAMVHAGGSLVLIDSVATFTTVEDFQQGVTIKTQHVGCCEVVIEEGDFTSENSYFQVDGIEFPYTVTVGSELPILIRLKDVPVNRTRAMEADTLSLTIGFIAIDIPIDYDEEIARDLSTPVVTPINNLSQTAEFNSATQQILFKESGVVNVNIYGIDGTLLANVAQGETLKSGNSISLQSVTESLASGLYVVEGTISQKPFSFKFEK